MQDNIEYLKIELLDKDRYFFAVGRVNKNEEVRCISRFDDTNKKKIIKKLNYAILYKCKKCKESEVRICFDYINTPDKWCSIEDIKYEIENNEERILVI